LQVTPSNVRVVNVLDSDLSNTSLATVQLWCPPVDSKISAASWRAPYLLIAVGPLCILFFIQPSLEPRRKLEPVGSYALQTDVSCAGVIASNMVPLSFCIYYYSLMCYFYSLLMFLAHTNFITNNDFCATQCDGRVVFFIGSFSSHLTILEYSPSSKSLGLLQTVDLELPVPNSMMDSQFAPAETSFTAPPAPESICVLGSDETSAPKTLLVRVGLRDGQLIQFMMTPSLPPVQVFTISNYHLQKVGILPVQLVPYESDCLALSNRALLLHNHEQSALAYSTVACATQIRIQPSPDALTNNHVLACVSEGCFCLLRIDTHQRFSARTICATGRTPRRIMCLPHLQLLAVLCTDFNELASRLVSTIMLVDPITGVTLGVYPSRPDETFLVLKGWDSHAGWFLVVSSLIASATSPAKSNGRISILAIERSERSASIDCVSTATVADAIFALTPLDSTRIVAGGKTLVMFTLNSQGILELTTAYSGSHSIIALASCPPSLTFGVVNQSDGVSLWRLNIVTGLLELVAKDPQPRLGADLLLSDESTMIALDKMGFLSVISQPPGGRFLQIDANVALVFPGSRVKLCAISRRDTHDPDAGVISPIGHERIWAVSSYLGSVQLIQTMDIRLVPVCNELTTRLVAAHFCKGFRSAQINACDGDSLTLFLSLTTAEQANLVRDWPVDQIPIPHHDGVLPVHESLRSIFATLRSKLV
jgi:hypothetical protein